jgi:hypothetical protein
MTTKYIDPLKIGDIYDYSARGQTILHVTFIRLDLYNNGKNCGPKAIQKEMRRLNIEKIPSSATIGRILKNQYLTHGRTGYYPGDPP